MRHGALPLPPCRQRPRLSSRRPRRASSWRRLASRSRLFWPCFRRFPRPQAPRPRPRRSARAFSSNFLSETLWRPRRRQRRSPLRLRSHRRRIVEHRGASRSGCGVFWALGGAFLGGFAEAAPGGPECRRAGGAEEAQRPESEPRSERPSGGRPRRGLGGKVPKASCAIRVCAFFPLF